MGESGLLCGRVRRGGAVGGHRGHHLARGAQRRTHPGTRRGRTRVRRGDQLGVARTSGWGGRGAASRTMSVLF